MMSDTTVLALCAALSFLMALAGSMIRARGWTPAGMKIAFGNRDNLPEATPLAARADRASKNMLENMVMFVAVLCAVHFAGKSGERITLGANLFLWARVAYWPMYLAGITYVRTLCWAVAVAGMALIGSTLFF
jgi:uncharacterized MAPEG superfamily protein